MQWEKFETFVATHLDLAPCLNEQLVPFAGKYGIKDIVQQQLEYVAVRPWTSLDLNLKGDYKLIADGEVNVLYTVYAHIGGNELPCTRARKSYRQDGSTIQQLIEEFKQWHPEYWGKQDDRPLIFDAVTRRSSLVNYKKVHFSEDKKALSFYLFLEGFTA